MHLKNLSSESLHSQLVSLCERERKLTLDILHHLREVDSRKLFASRGHSSLFAYVVEELHYSESAAQRRIFAMRALRELPELEVKVQSGELKITQLAQVQSFFQTEKKGGVTYSMSEKRELIESTLGKSTRETEKILAEKNPEAFISKEKLRVLTPELTQVSFTADESLMGNLQGVRNRFAHQLPVNASFADVIRFMAKMTLKQSPEEKTTRGGSKNNPEDGGMPIPAHSVPAPVIASRYIPAGVKRVVWSKKALGCAFTSPVTGKICASLHRLQMDHIHPFSLGGSSADQANLRLLCFTHNQLRAWC